MIAGPLTVDSRSGMDGVKYFVIEDLTGKVICDTINSEVVVVQEESDGDENATWVNRWDSRGKADMEFLAHAGNCYHAMLEALKAAEVILRLSNQDFSTNDMGKFRGITLRSTLREVQSALEIDARKDEIL